MIKKESDNKGTKTYLRYIVCKSVYSFGGDGIKVATIARLQAQSNHYIKQPIGFIQNVVASS